MAAASAAIISPPWWPEYPPHRKQMIALWAYQETPELCYGGAAGGGKTDYLLMAASQYCMYSDYAALIIRKSYPDLALPNAIMDRAIKWWAGQYGIRWQPSDYKMIWPSGAVVQFGHMSNAQDHLRYQGAQLHFVGFDEATQIPENQLVYLHSRLRAEQGSPIPIRYRLATNPGGISHDFIRRDYVIGADGHERVYLPALLHENPGLNQEEYRQRLARLDPITRQQLEDGDWDVHLSGGFFEVENVGEAHLRELPKGMPTVRAWDLAATPEQPGTDPDWTVGIKIAMVDGEFWILDMKRVRAGPAAVERLMGATAEEDGIEVQIIVEQEPGSAGVLLKNHLARGTFRGFDYRAVTHTGSKYDEAKPLAGAISNHLVLWTHEAAGRSEALAELRAFSDDPKMYAHDDVVDAMAMGYNMLARPKPPPIVLES